MSQEDELRSAQAQGCKFGLPKLKRYNVILSAPDEFILPEVMSDPWVSPWIH